MREIIGILLISAVFGAIFAGLFYSVGTRVGLCILGASLILSAALITGIFLLSG